MQQRLLSDPPLPPLGMDDFPTDEDEFKIISESTSKSDILQEILSVAQASQQILNQSSRTNASSSSYDHNNYAWGDGGSYHQYAPINIDHDFSFSTADATTSAAMMRSSIAIGDHIVDNDDQEFKADDHAVVENLRWVGMSSKDMEKVKLIHVRSSFLAN